MRVYWLGIIGWLLLHAAAVSGEDIMCGCVQMLLLYLEVVA
jgi:hypothetical protein